MYWQLQGWGLRFPCNDRTDEVKKLFIICLYRYSSNEYNQKHRKWFSTSALKRSFKVVITEAKWTWRCHRNHMQDTVSLTKGNFGTEPTINWKPTTGPWITLQNTSPFIHSIHHCHIDHKETCLLIKISQVLSRPKRNRRQ